MSPSIVRRVEHSETHLGPWCEGGFGLDAGRIPMPYADGIYDYPGEGALHGFEESRHLAYFTPGDRRRLQESGYVLATYMVPPGPLCIRRGRVQVVFNPEAAICVKRMPMWRNK